MDKKNFYELIDSSSNFSPISLEQIKSLVDKYPYFQSARILYLINLKHIRHESFNKEIQGHSIFVPCRQNLFRKLYPTQPANFNPEVYEDKVETKRTDRVSSKNSSTESSFILLEDQNHSDSITIDIEPTSVSNDSDILELIEGDNESLASNPNTSSLIDAFLSNVAKIERPQMPSRGEVVENEDISLKSIEEPEELASEPLAHIYITQGYFEKALAVYEKLCLKYPEKSSYFADQIQKVKEQINSKH